jgi:hypothetical protein
MIVVLFRTGPGTIWPIVLVVAGSLSRGAVALGTLAPSVFLETLASDLSTLRTRGRKRSRPQASCPCTIAGKRMCEPAHATAATLASILEHRRRSTALTAPDSAPRRLRDCWAEAIDPAARAVRREWWTGT